MSLVVTLDNHVYNLAIYCFSMHITVYLHLLLYSPPQAQIFWTCLRDAYVEFVGVVGGGGSGGDRGDPRSPKSRIFAYVILERSLRDHSSITQAKNRDFWPLDPPPPKKQFDVSRSKKSAPAAGSIMGGGCK